MWRRVRFALLHITPQGVLPRRNTMIKITRLNDTVLVINAEMIQFLEATPDTIITLTDGRKVVAKEPVDEIIDKVVEYKHRFLIAGPEVRSRQT
jgi:flagellar protein FlbD